jgi:hypothetical protein
MTATSSSGCAPRFPSNSLAALYGVARDCAERGVLAPQFELEIHTFDETNSRIRPARIAALIAAAGSGMVMLVGVQSSQFPRALDLARPLRERGIQVGIGGFHVSGVLSMLNGVDADLEKAKVMGVSLFAGEAEGSLDTVLRDAAAGRLAPLYNSWPSCRRSRAHRSRCFPRTACGAQPAASPASMPDAAAPTSARSALSLTCRDGTRRRSPDDIEQIVRLNRAQGLRGCFITDDNFARNKDWEPILDRLIKLRQDENLRMRFIIQVDTLCHKLPNFIEKCARAGV